jgi:phosphodiesterase/alkaline phosphatase D-like protein
MIDRRDFLVGSTTLAASLAFIRCGKPVPATTWTWAGGVTPESASVRALMPVESPLLLSTSADLSGAIEIAPASFADGIHRFELSELSPSTRYFYGIGDQSIASFKTFPAGPSPLRIAFGSCADTGSEHAVFTAIADSEPDLFIHLGDMHYENIGDPDIARYRKALGQVFSSSVQSHLYGNTPIAYVWDDHDYGPNDSGRASPSRDAACRAYRELVPHYPVAEHGPIHQAFTVGGVRIVLLDTRSERVPDGTLLGRPQVDWLMAELERSTKTHSLVIVGSTVTWIGEGGDTWGGFSREREELARFVRERSMENVVMIAGDAHMAAYDDGRNNRYSGSTDPSFPIFFASSFDKPGSTKGGPYSGKVVEGRGHFGLLEIQDDGRGPLAVKFSARDSRDRELLRHELSVPQLNPGV